MSPAGAWDKPLDLIYRREEGMDARIEAQSVRKSSNSLRQSLATEKVELGEFSTDASNRRSHPCCVGRETEDNRKTVSKSQPCESVPGKADTTHPARNQGVHRYGRHQNR
jgi:hypothetical protein